MDIAGVTQQRLAELMGVKQEAVHHWLHRGSVPRSATLLKLCEFFNVTAEWLVTGEGDPNKPKADSKGGTPARDRWDEQLRRLPTDIRADLAILGEAAHKSSDTRQMLAHLARTFQPPHDPSPRYSNDLHRRGLRDR